MFSLTDSFNFGAAAAKRPRLEPYSIQNTCNYIHSHRINNLEINPHFLLQQQPSKSFWLTPEKMKEYLKDEKNLECVLSFSFPKVFKKSYGIENRFIILPPTITLKGFGWNKFFKEPLSSESINASMEICGTKKSTQLFMDMVEINDSNIVAQFQTRKLFITKDEEKSMCRLSAYLHFPNGSTIKGIQSGHIKVMSKGSKKKKIDTATTNGSSSFIKNGSYIALFIRGPGTITRYLHCNSAGFCANLKQWSVYKIYSVDEQTGEHEFSYNSEKKFIYYQQNVLLVDTTTETSLPIMKIRKCGHTENKVYKFENNVNEPVCPFHMISFEYIDKNGNILYLATQNSDGIGWKSLTNPSKGINNEVKWNIITADRYLYRFYPLNGLEKISMLNFPIVLSINSTKLGDEWLEFEGRGFTKDIQIWFNTYPSCQTIYRSSSTITCVIPTLVSYYNHCSNLEITDTLTVPLYLVTFYGTIYPIPFLFAYNARKVGKIGHIIHVHEMDRNTVEQPVNA